MRIKAKDYSSIDNDIFNYLILVPSIIPLLFYKLHRIQNISTAYFLVALFEVKINLRFLGWWVSF